MRRMFDFLTHIYRYVFNKTFFQYNHLGKNVAFDSNVYISNPEFVDIGNYVHIQTDVWIDIINKKSNPLLIIGDYSDLGKRTFISVASKVVIGRKVLIAPNVHITDHNHQYQNPNIPVINQGITAPLPVEIGDGTWIGINAVILPGIKIGKNCVIGANSVVTNSVPNFCVAAGNPAKVIKRYIPKARKWD